MTVILSSVFSFLGAHPGLLVAGFLLYCFIYALSILFSGPKPGRNPFSAKHVRPPPEKIVPDHKTRNAILKQSKSSRYSEVFADFRSIGKSSAHFVFGAVPNYPRCLHS